MRLVKYLAHAGVASRRASEKLIAEGRVSIAGQTVTDPARDVDEDSGVALDGRPVEREPREVWALHKPAGVVSTAREPGSRRAVTDLVDSARRLYPVGRLDAESTGLILLTNDGELANRLTHPRYEVERTYRVALHRAPEPADLQQLRDGVELDDGQTGPARVRKVSPRILEITLREGRNRQIRRMAEAIGNRVESLSRTRFGPVELGALREGESRRLRAGELSRLWQHAGMERGKRSS